MLSLSEERIEKIKYSNIAITRGNDAELVLPIILNTNGTKTPYTPQAGDTFELQVRKSEVKKANPVPDLIFQGNVSVNLNNTLVWSISSTDTTQDCGTYYWDVDIHTGGKTYTFYCGWFTILPESTLPPTP